MVILKNISLNNITTKIVLICVVLVKMSPISFAECEDAKRLLSEACDSGYDLKTAEVESLLYRMEIKLYDCQDKNSARQIKYQMGMVCYKSKMYEKSRGKFTEIINDSTGPDLIKVCSYNMLGLIYRLRGKDNEALEMLEQTARLSYELIQNAAKSYSAVPLITLRSLALVGRAEIYEIQRDYQAAIAEYERLFSNTYEQADVIYAEDYEGLACDRICQLYLRQGDIVNYLEYVQRLSADYPQYYRTPMVTFEAECVKYLRNLPGKSEVVDCGYDAPVLLIKRIKEADVAVSSEPLIKKIEDILLKYDRGYGSILLRYHYAWLLDAIGDKDRAVEQFIKVMQTKIDDKDISFRNGFIESIQDYAKIQCAIILGEKGEYDNAEEVLGKIEKKGEGTHIAVLSESVMESIETLKKEVRGNDGE